MDAPGFERVRQPLRRQLVQISDLRSEHQGDQQTTTELEGMVQRKDAEHAFADAQIEEAGDLRRKRGEVAVREQDAFRLSGGAAGEEQGSHCVLATALAQRRRLRLLL